MSFPQKAGVGKPNKLYTHRFSNYHETTTSFAVVQPFFIKRIKGKSNINFNYDAYCRLLPMPAPTLGIANMHIKWYKLPMRIFWNGWNNFRTQTLAHDLGQTQGFINQVPYIDYTTLASIFSDATTYGLNALTTPSTDQNNYDWIDNTGVKVNFTPEGILVYTILNSLGYNLIAAHTKANTQLNALPLIAYAKLMLDEFTPKEFNDSEIVFNQLYGYFNQTNSYSLPANIVASIFSIMKRCPYTEDYFTEAWTNPNGPSNGGYMTDSIPSLDGTGMITTNTNGTAVLSGLNISAENIEQLKAMDKWLKTNQIVGTKYWDRLLAQYGITTDKALIKVPQEVDHKVIPVKFDAVLSNTENLDPNTGQGAVLGAMAGNGHIDIENALHFDTFVEEDSYLIGVSYIVPEVAYSNGFDRECLNLGFHDFYIDKYDGTGVEGQKALELYSGIEFTIGNNTDATAISDLLTRIRGFLPLYASEKSMNNKITGLFNLGSMRNQLSQWTFQRIFDRDSFTLSNNTINISQNLQFKLIRHGDGNTGFVQTQYDRIFVTPDYPNFMTFFRFNWDMQNTMKPLYYYENIKDDDEKLIKMDV